MLVLYQPNSNKLIAHQSINCLNFLFPTCTMLYLYLVQKTLDAWRCFIVSCLHDFLIPDYKGILPTSTSVRCGSLQLAISHYNLWADQSYITEA
ncbi:hypothetical protein BD408DRAFT_424602, partial [Parasitella parasitica]